MKRSNIWQKLIPIALGLLLSGASGGGRDEKHQTKASTHSHETEHKARASAYATPFQIIVQPAPVQIVEPSGPAKERRPPQKWYERPTITDWGIFVVTVAYTGVSIRLLCATRRQAILAKRTLRETKKSADAAKKSADAAIAVSAAYVHIMRLSLEDIGSLYMKSVADPVLRYGFTNYGKSPAGMLEMCWEYRRSQ